MGFSNYVIFKSFCILLMMVDVEYLKAHLPTCLVPSTPVPYLGSRSEIVRVPWSLHALMAYFFVGDHGNALMSLDFQILQVA